MPKPRTNADTIERWADSILEREPAPSYEVNSIIVSNDVVFSFGRHWPMGVIERGPGGKVRRVYLNSDHCSSMGFANTDGDQWTVTLAAQAAAAKMGAEIVKRPMGTGWRVSGDGMVECRPNPSDPRPPSDWSCEIPTVFYATNPGPEPVDDGVGCIVGHSEEYTYQTTESHYHGLSLPARIPLGAHPRGRMNPGTTYESVEYVVEHTGRLTWRKPHYWETFGGQSSANEDKVCPHCLTFAKLHARWREQYAGPYRGRNRGKGWRLYSEMMERFGTADEWREQRLVEFRRVREGRKTFAAWRERNYMPVASLPAQGSGPLNYVPRLDREGYPLRKDSEAYFRMKRAGERNRRRAAREHEARQRYERQVERFARGMRNRRKPSFVQTAAQIASELRAVNDAMAERMAERASTELESTPTKEQ